MPISSEELTRRLADADRRILALRKTTLELRAMKIKRKPHSETQPVTPTSTVEKELPETQEESTND
ncbi:MAG TPA: hypothetical protein VGQ72_02745 [Pyrinomonadaceae bacterium]|jgi:hypothetical protein|nr:hypothetical protein [Pyrinomonadaceae bacterium]